LAIYRVSFTKVLCFEIVPILLYTTWYSLNMSTVIKQSNIVDLDIIWWLFKWTFNWSIIRVCIRTVSIIVHKYPSACINLFGYTSLCVYILICIVFSVFFFSKFVIACSYFIITWRRYSLFWGYSIEWLLYFYWFVWFYNTLVFLFWQKSRLGKECWGVVTNIVTLLCCC